MADHEVDFSVDTEGLEQEEALVREARSRHPRANKRHAALFGAFGFIGRNARDKTIDVVLEASYRATELAIECADPSMMGIPLGRDEQKCLRGTHFSQPSLLETVRSTRQQAPAELGRSPDA
jgi:hypothetical protein